MSILNVEHLTHGFGDRVILDDVSFRLLKGEHIGLVGANGEGKSTFLNIVTGKLMPDEGKVEWAKNQDGREVKDGDAVKKGQLLATVKGDVRVLLSGERTALNYLQRLSGIATYTHQVARLLEGSSTTLLDTRKTTPNMRLFEKYAVKVGGATNHRYNLSDCAMLKDTHLDAYGSMTGAVNALREKMGHTVKIEVEVGNLEELKEALTLGVEIIMLDNMTPEQMKEAIKVIDGRALTECSGNVTKENIKNIIDVGVDYVSSGALTHSAPIMDISLKNLHAI